MAHSKSQVGACVVYLRTSSSANIGDDKDSEPRQREACKIYVRGKDWQVKAEFRDPAVSGTDPLICRGGFAECVGYCVKHRIKYIIVESGDRFAQNLVVQETALEWLEEVGLELICADNETQFTEPSAVQQNNHVLRLCAITPQVSPMRSAPPGSPPRLPRCDGTHVVYMNYRCVKCTRWCGRCWVL